MNTYGSITRKSRPCLRMSRSAIVKTDHIFHPTSDGGLIILTGIPNSGKTDFLNCMMAHLMFQRQKRIAFFSFEKPIKAKHVREIARVALGVEDTASMDHTMNDS